MRINLSKQPGLSLMAVLASGLLIACVMPDVSWALSPVNTVNDGKIVSGGNYYSSAQGKTTFINSGSGGLWVKSDTTVRGLEVDELGNLTQNGGVLHFFYPNGVVRIDGNVNVNAVLNSQGAPLGNGGRVFVDSAYLFQNGNIFANGINGGLVQMNVAGLTLGPTARIEAKGLGGMGGIVSVNSNGIVDLQRGSRVDTSGQIPEGMDRNVINIEGSIVNAEGVLRADGVSVGDVGSRGGQIRLVASGRTDLSDAKDAFTDAASGVNPTLTSAEQTSLLGRAQFLADNMDGDVQIAARSFNGTGQPTGGWLSVNGSSGTVASNNDVSEDPTARAGDGGTIILAAENRIVQRGLASANGGDGINGVTATAGGNGGLITLVSSNSIDIAPDTGDYSGVFQANGGRGGQIRLASGSVPSDLGTRGGQGGLIAFSYNTQMSNSGGIVAKGGTGAHGAVVGGGPVAQGDAGNGGKGGLVVFSGDANPVGGGQVNVNGGRGGAGSMGDGVGGDAGTIVSLNPSTLPFTQVAFQYIGGNSSTALGTAQPLTEETAQDEILTRAENLILLRRNSPSLERPLTLFGSALFGDTGSLFSSNSKIRSVNDPFGSGDALTLVLSKTPSGEYPYRNYVVGSSADDLLMNMNAPFLEEWQGISNLTTLTVANDGIAYLAATPDLMEFNSYGGSHLSILSKSLLTGQGEINLGGNLAGGTLNIASQGSIFLNSRISSSVRTGIGVVGFHAGSVTLKASEEIQNLASISIFNGTPLIGMTHRYQSGGDFTNAHLIDSDAGFGSLATPTNGGIITIKTASQFHNVESLFPGSTEITANGKSLQGYGGLVKLEAVSFDIPSPELIQANGTTQSGTVIVRTLP